MLCKRATTDRYSRVCMPLLETMQVIIDNILSTMWWRSGHLYTVNRYIAMRMLVLPPVHTGVLSVYFVHIALRVLLQTPKSWDCITYWCAKHSGGSYVVSYVARKLPFRCKWAVVLQRARSQTRATIVCVCICIAVPAGWSTCPLLTLCFCLLLKREKGIQ